MKRPVHYCHIVNHNQSLAFAGTSLDMMATSGCKEHSQCSHRLLCPTYCAAPVATTCVDWVTGGLRSHFQKINKFHELEKAKEQGFCLPWGMDWQCQSSAWCLLCPQQCSCSQYIVSCFVFIVLHIIVFLKYNKVMCSVSENLLTSDICQGLRLSRMLCCGKAHHPIRHEILGISDISQGFRASRMWCIGNALHPVI